MKKRELNRFLKNIRSFFIFTLILCSILSSFSSFASAAGIPSIISYQGRLTDASGNLLGGSGTAYWFKFSLYDASSGGNKVWPTGDPTGFTSTVRQGVFNVNIGDTVNLYPDTLDYNFNANKNVYLRVDVSTVDSGYETLSPRQQINATAFAKLAEAVSGTNSSSFGTTTPIANSIVTIESTTTASIPLSLRGILGQTANLFNIQNSLGANLFSINNLGGIFASSTLGVTGATNLYSTLNVANLSTFTNASSTIFSNTGTAYFGGTATSSFNSAGVLTLVSALGLSSGGTGTSTAPTYGKLLVGNSLGTYDLVATSSLGITGGSGITSLGAQYSSGQTGVTQTFATSSDTNIGLNVTSSGDTHTFTPTWSGLLSVARGGTGWGNIQANALVLGNGTGAVATTSAGTNGYTLALVGGVPTWTATTTFSTGLSYSGGIVTLNQTTVNDYANTYIHASSTIPKTYTANTFTGLQTLNGGLTVGTLNGPLQANAGVVSATTSIGVLYGGTGLQSIASSSLLIGGPNNTFIGYATSSLGIAISDTTGTLAVSRGGTGQTTFTSSQLLYGNGTNGLTSVGSSSISFDSSLTSGGTFGYLVGGSSPTLSLNLTNPNSWTGLQSFANASSTIFSNTGTAYFGGTATSTFNSAGVLTLTNLNGPLQANAGVVSATTSVGILYGGTGATTAAGARTNLGVAASGANSDITSLAGLTTALSVPQGGTGWGNIQANSLLLGNGTGAIATTTAGTNGYTLALVSGVPTWTATTTFSTGLTYSGGNVTLDQTTVNNYANAYIHASTTIPKMYTTNTFTALNTFNGGLTIGSLNGPLQANAGVVSATTSIGVLYGGTGLTSAPAYGDILVGNALSGYTKTATSSLGLLTAIGPAGQTQTGPTITLATSSTAFNGLTSSTTITGSGNTITFANTLAGLLGVGGGGTGISSPVATQILLGSYAGGGWQQLATSSLGIALSDTTGTLSVSKGGTGQTSFTSSQLLYGTGTGGLQTVGTTSLAVDGTSILSSGTLGYQIGGSASTLSLNLTNSNSWTGLQSFANASSTLFSNTGTAYFGGTATSTFNSAGVLSLAGFTQGSLVFAGANGALSQDNASIFFDDSTNRLGLGTTTPGTTLAVAGTGLFNEALTVYGNISAPYFTATSTTATSTFSGGLNIAGASGITTYSTGRTLIGTTTVGTLNNSEDLIIGAGIKISASTTASGISQKLVFYAPDDNNNAIYSSNGGILNIGGFLSVQNYILSQGGYYGGLINPIVGYYDYRNSTYAGLYSPAVGETALFTSGIEAIRMNATGLVGIGTTTPFAQLSASSTSSVVAAFDQRGTSDILQLLDSGSLAFVVKDGGNVGVASSSPWGLLSVNPSGISGPAFVVGSSTVTNFIINNNGNVGIGTTTPYAKLSVVGPVVAEYFHATSTTATSTISGIFSVGSTTPNGSSIVSLGTSTLSALTQNRNTGNWGIGTTTSNDRFVVVGSTTVSRAITAGAYGTSTISSPASGSAVDPLRSETGHYTRNGNRVFNYRVYATQTLLNQSIVSATYKDITYTDTYLLEGPTTLDVQPNYGGTGYTDDADINVSVYSYKTISAIKYYTTNPPGYFGSPGGVGDPISRDWVWDADANATGYLLVDSDNSKYVDVGNVLTYSDDGTGWTNGSPDVTTYQITGSTNIDVTWGAVTGATGYIVTLDNYLHSGYTTYKTFLTTTTSWTDNGSYTGTSNPPVATSTYFADKQTLYGQLKTNEINLIGGLSIKADDIGYFNFSTNSGMFIGKGAPTALDGVIGIGQNAGTSLTSASAEAICIGKQSCEDATTESGFGSVVIGKSAAANNTTLNNTIAIGGNANGVAGGSNESGIFIGTYAGAQTQGNYNTYMGYSAGYGVNSSGSENIGIGSYAVRSITTGSSNVALGRRALFDITTQSYNVAIGDYALNAATGTANVALGQNAGRGLTGAGTATNNTYIGASAGYLGLGGLTNATAIGYNAQVGSSNSLVLGGTGASGVNVGIGTTTPWGLLSVNPNGITGPAFVVGSSTATKLIVTNAGNVGIGTTTPWRTFSVNGTVSFAGLNTGTASGVLCRSSTNEVLYEAAASCTISSARFKHDIESLDSSGGLSLVNALRPVTFEFNETNKKAIGFIAEEVNLLDPRLVFYEPDGITPRGVNYEQFAPILTKAIQELSASTTNLNNNFVLNTASSTASTSPAISFDGLGNALILGKLTAGSIEAKDIRGLSIYADKISYLEDKIASSTGETASALDSLYTDINSQFITLNTTVTSFASAIDGFASTTAEMNSRLDLFNTWKSSFDGLLSVSTSTGLTAPQGLTIQGGLTVDIIKGADASTTIAMMNDVEFFGTPYFTKDTAGFATIKEGATSVNIVFDREYIYDPIVNASITVGDDEKLSDMILESDIRYIVTKKSKTGFTIKLSKASPADIPFSWTAFAVKDAHTFFSEVPEAPAETPPVNSTVQDTLPPPTTEEPDDTPPTDTGVEDVTSGEINPTEGDGAVDETPPSDTPVVTDDDTLEESPPPSDTPPLEEPTSTPESSPESATPPDDSTSPIETPAQ